MSLLSERSIDRVTDLESSVETVLLHGLCEGCEEFFQRWDILHWLEQQESTPATTWPVSRLCNVAHLVKHNTSCHLCRFLLASLQRSITFGDTHDLDLNVYLHPQENEDNVDQLVHARVAKETLLDDTGKTFLAAFALKKYKRKSVCHSRNLQLN
jgi:hypothetical protein